MAYVPSQTPFGVIGTQVSSPRTQATSTAQETDEERQKRTGVDPGGQGAVSGQVPPGGYAGQVPAATGPADPLSAARAGATSAQTQAPTDPLSQARAALGAAGTTTATGALTSPSAPPPPAASGNPYGAPAPGTTAAGASGTTQGPNALGPVGTAASSLPVIGGTIGAFTSPTTVDLTPVHAAQNAAFGLGANLGQERYDYAPGTAPAQNVVGLDTGQEDQIRARQLGALDQLTAAASGNVPSAAEIQGQRQAGTDAANILGAARALGGRSAGGVARAASLGAADTLAKTRADAMAGRATETANARNALANALEGTRGQDIGVAGTNAGLTQQAYGNNLNAQLTADQLAEKHREDLLNAQLQAYGVGTTAATGGANAAGNAAAAENKLKGGMLDTLGSALGL
jgi:hypothetical protein